MRKKRLTQPGDLKVVECYNVKIAEFEYIADEGEVLLVEYKCYADRMGVLGWMICRYLGVAPEKIELPWWRRLLRQWYRKTR